MNLKLKQIEYNTDMFKKIKNVMNKTNNPIPALVDNNGLLISNSKDKANLIDFEKVHSLNINLGSACHEMEVNNLVSTFLNSPAPNLEDYEKTTYSEIKRAIKKLKNKKSSASDKIPNTALKHLPAIGIELLANLTNGILRLSYFPKDWKCAHIIPIVKPNKPANDVKSLRPISLLCSMSKIIERIITVINIIPNK